MDLLALDQLQAAAFAVVGDHLKVARLLVHVQQRIVRDAIAVLVDRHISGDSFEFTVPHELRHSGTVHRLVQRVRILGNALVERVRVQQNGIVEGGHERADRFIGGKGVIVSGGRSFFDLIGKGQVLGTFGLLRNDR